MVRIRLRRIGLTHQPSYRIVVADKESPRDGRFLEIIGSYNPQVGSKPCRSVSQGVAVCNCLPKTAWPPT